MLCYRQYLRKCQINFHQHFIVYGLMIRVQFIQSLTAYTIYHLFGLKISSNRVNLIPDNTSSRSIHLIFKPKPLSRCIIMCVHVHLKILNQKIMHFSLSAKKRRQARLKPSELTPSGYIKSSYWQPAAAITIYIIHYKAIILIII